MYKEKISKEEYKVLKKYAPHTIDYVKLKEYDFEVDIIFNDYDEFAINMEFDIAMNGMNNQDTLNEVGEILITIHDRIYYK